MSFIVGHLYFKVSSCFDMSLVNSAIWKIIFVAVSSIVCISGGCCVDDLVFITSA